TVFQYTLVAWYLFWASFALMGFHLLIIISKMVMIGEDNLIMEGMLHKNKAIFRQLQGAIPFAVLFIASIMFFLSLTVSVFALDKMLPGVVLYSHDEVNFLYRLVMMILQIPLIKEVVDFFELINLDNMPLHLTSTYGAALNISIELTIGVMVYSAIMLQLKQIKQIKSLIKAFESDEADIQYIQQRATHFPSIVKEELINLSLNHPNSKVRKRAISVASYAQIVSFPQAFLYRLHREKENYLKEWGLKQILKILSDPEVVLDDKRRHLINNHLKFQTKKQHSDVVMRLLHDIAEKLVGYRERQADSERISQLKSYKTQSKQPNTAISGSQRKMEDEKRRQAEIAKRKVEAEKQRQAEIARQKAEAEKQRQAEIAQQKAKAEKLAEIVKQKEKQKSYRYIDKSDGTVTDNKTGLIWLKNANCFGRQNWEKAMQSAAQLADGQCGLSDGSKPSDWRLPTIEEWEAMIDKNYERPALSNAEGTDQWKEGDAFSSVQTSLYWSSTTDASFTGSAWIVSLSYGFVGYSDKVGNNDVWPVRGGDVWPVRGGQ
ncbi:MAG: DUF1566 domain-containing protein, partial [Candidatus Parabeggiatoa sp.]|nr:DUF1566 domain-containing protein [Candidatus Parabeggiatoa sp.]